MDVTYTPVFEQIDWFGAVLFDYVSSVPFSAGDRKRVQKWEISFSILTRGRLWLKRHVSVNWKKRNLGEVSGSYTGPNVLFRFRIRLRRNLDTNTVLFRRRRRRHAARRYFLIVPRRWGEHNTSPVRSRNVLAAVSRIRACSVTAQRFGRNRHTANAFKKKPLPPPPPVW